VSHLVAQIVDCLTSRPEKMITWKEIKETLHIGTEFKKFTRFTDFHRHLAADMRKIDEKV
jgi:hypothetical protein